MLTTRGLQTNKHQRHPSSVAFVTELPVGGPTETLGNLLQALQQGDLAAICLGSSSPLVTLMAEMLRYSTQAFLTTRTVYGVLYTTGIPVVRGSCHQLTTNPKR